MDSEKALALVALIWLFGSVLLMARSIRIGRALTRQLARQDPETYEALGRPRPGFFYSARRSRFAQFLGRREYEDLTDRSLAEQFDAYRISETRLVLSVLVSGAFLGGLALAATYIP